MSRDNLSSLLDAMLDQSEIDLAAETEREREAEAAREAVRAEKQAAAARAFDDLAALLGLPEGELRKVLAKAAPDDLLIVLATAEDALQRRILKNLSPDSVRWVRENLAHIDAVSNAERESAEKKLVKVANALLSAGEIGLPEAVGADAPDAAERDLRELLTDLVRIAAQAGPDALKELLESSGEPLLSRGLARVDNGERGDALRAALAEDRAELEAAYARRLAWIEEALVAIAERENPESFRARVFR